MRVTRLRKGSNCAGAQRCQVCAPINRSRRRVAESVHRFRCDRESFQRTTDPPLGRKKLHQRTSPHVAQHIRKSKCKGRNTSLMRDHYIMHGVSDLFLHHMFGLWHQRCSSVGWPRGAISEHHQNKANTATSQDFTTIIGIVNSVTPGNDALMCILFQRSPKVFAGSLQRKVHARVTTIYEPPVDLDQY